MFCVTLTALSVNAEVLEATVLVSLAQRRRETEVLVAMM